MEKREGGRRGNEGEGERRKKEGMREERKGKREGSRTIGAE